MMEKVCLTVIFLLYQVVKKQRLLLSMAKVSDKPIIILDDVMSELDNEHKERLITFVRGLEQVFITSTNTTVKNASIYEVKQHNITRRNAKW